MKFRHLIALLTLGAAALPAWADRQPGWDFGAELLYQSAKDIDFDGGSRADLEDDLGIALVFGYRFNERFELIFGLDWNTIDYDFNVISDVPALSFSGTGDLESWTPRVGVNVNILKGDFTPYVTGGVGWAFIDTNIPTGPPQTSCWWDPWWGYYCGTFQNTRSMDELMYNIGLGVRWDISSTITLRLGYEKHWLDIGEATSTPDLDQIKFGIAARY
jgi:opacity protein-like surface antigen